MMPSIAVKRKYISIPDAGKQSADKVTICQADINSRCIDSYYFAPLLRRISRTSIAVPVLKIIAPPIPCITRTEIKKDESETKRKAQRLLKNYRAIKKDSFTAVNIGQPCPTEPGLSRQPE